MHQLRHKGHEQVTKELRRLVRQLRRQHVDRRDEDATLVRVHRVGGGALLHVCNVEGSVDGRNLLDKLDGTAAVRRQVGDTNEAGSLRPQQLDHRALLQQARVPLVPVGAVDDGRGVRCKAFGKAADVLLGVLVVVRLVQQGLTVAPGHADLGRGDGNVHLGVVKGSVSHEVRQVLVRHLFVWQQLEELERTSGHVTAARQHKDERAEVARAAVLGEPLSEELEGLLGRRKVGVHVGSTNVKEGGRVAEGEEAIAKVGKVVNDASIAGKATKAHKALFDTRLFVQGGNALVVNEANVVCHTLS
mmetsp:Transcript_7452/g.23822  ORF Transcript_7452/g.23822 Transcript_7452/m.23822 type:complete len:303 (-) Transcript_7452:384-1292(-)